mgnify:CR=1 FL=1|jgi:hypothetical protein
MTIDNSEYCPMSNEDFAGDFQLENLPENFQDVLDPCYTPDIYVASPKSTFSPGLVRQPKSIQR